MRLQLDIEQDETRLTFEYRGRDLAAPLRLLIDRHRAAIVKLRAELEQVKPYVPVPGQKAPVLPTLGDLGANPGARVKLLESKIRKLRGTLDDAELLMSEAQRTPRRTWVLSMAQLRWLKQSEVGDESPNDGAESGATGPGQALPIRGAAPLA